jgi:hypothetical protein
VSRLIDLSGRKFGRWLATSEFESRPYKIGTKIYWKVICSCPAKTEKLVLSSSLIEGRSISCGCFHREAIKKANTTHGQARGKKTREYRIWRSMISRCTNPKSISYPNYGGRGITICDWWLHSFENFYEDMGPCPPQFSLDRINSHGPFFKAIYEPPTTVFYEGHNFRPLVLQLLTFRADAEIICGSDLFLLDHMNWRADRAVRVHDQANLSGH